MVSRPAGGMAATSDVVMRQVAAMDFCSWLNSVHDDFLHTRAEPLRIEHMLTKCTQKSAFVCCMAAVCLCGRLRAS